MFNTEDVYTLAGTELLARRGCLFSPELKDAMMGLPPRAAFEVVITWHHLDEPWEVLAAESDVIFLGLLSERLTTMPGLLELLAALETAGIPKAIATSSGRRLTEACLGPFRLAPRFRFILTSEDITHGKAGPGDLSAGSAASSACRRRKCSCWKTARTAAVPRPLRGPSSWPCPASTAAARISAWQAGDRESRRSKAVRGAGDRQKSGEIRMMGEMTKSE